MSKARGTNFRFMQTLKGGVGFALLLLGVVIGAILTSGYVLYQCGRDSTPGNLVCGNQGEKQTQNWPLFRDREYGFYFRYPPYLTIVSQNREPEGQWLRVVDFLGRECAPTPALERGRVPSVHFSITRVADDDFERHMTVCSDKLGFDPNCRERSEIKFVPLGNGLQARLRQIFGVSGDRIELVITKSGLNFVFSTGTAPHPCGERRDYIQEMFQMAETLTFVDVSHDQP